MRKTALTPYRPIRVLHLLAALSLSSSALAADMADRNTLWSELRTAARVTCPQDVDLPRPLVAAAACGDLERVRDRVTRGADLAATDHRPAFAGRSALHHAAQRGDAAILALLLDAGANANAADAAGNTPLHLLAAAQPGMASVDMAKRLLAYGADATLANAQGRTPAMELDAVARRTLSPLHLDRKGLRELLQQAQATGPVRTAEPSLLRPTQAQAEPAVEPPAAGAAAEAPAQPEPAAEAAAGEPTASVAQAPAVAAPVTAETPEAKPVATTEPNPAPATEPAPVAAAEPKPEPAPEARPAPETKPVAAAEPAPAAQAEAPAAQDSAEIDARAVRSALERWAADWSSGNVDAYLAHYSRNFVPSDGNTLAGWKEQRRLRVGKADSIRVTLSDVAIEVAGKQAVARFLQDYQSETYKVVNRKQLDFAREASAWKITSERTLD